MRHKLWCILLSAWFASFPLGCHCLQPPHCTSTSIYNGFPSQGDGTGSPLQEFQFEVNFNATVCFRMQKETNENSGRQDDVKTSLLHTITLEKFEHHHRVTQKYDFAIPKVSTQCFCECAREECTAAHYQMKKCIHVLTKSCYRSYFNIAASRDCEKYDEPSLCCATTLVPVGKTYTALRVEAPRSYATLIYAAYDYRDGQWVEEWRKPVIVEAAGTTHETNFDDLKLSVRGSASDNRLDSGMYFTDVSDGAETETLWMEPLNDMRSQDLMMLGWFRRMEDGRFDVAGDVHSFRNAHFVNTTSCKEGDFEIESHLNARYFETDSAPSGLNLSSADVRDRYTWIRRAWFHDGKHRHVIVSHRTSAPVQVFLKSVVGEILFFTNTSRLTSFSGSIKMDQHSNHYIDLTLVGAIGKIDGVIYYGDSAHHFPLYVHEVESTDNRSEHIVSLPGDIGMGDRRVCLRSQMQASLADLCAVLPFSEEPLNSYFSNGKFVVIKGTGKGSGCGLLDLSCHVRKIVPAGLFDGGAPGFFAKLGEMDLKTLAMCLAVAFGAYVLLFKIMIPCCQCCLCLTKWKNELSGGPQEKKKKRKQKHARGRRVNVIRDSTESDLGVFL